MKNDTVLLVQGADKVAHVEAKNALHRARFRSHDMNLDSARAQGGRNFKPDEARADHECTLCRFCRVDDRAAICERTQHKDMRFLRPGDGQCERFRSSREQKTIIAEALPAGGDRSPRRYIDRRHFGIETELYVCLAVIAIVLE